MLSSVIRTNAIISKNIIAPRVKLLHRKHCCLDVTVQTKRFTARAAKFKKKLLSLHRDPWVACLKRKKNS